MRRVISVGFVFLSVIGLSEQQARADAKLPALFSDGMVLQSAPLSWLTIQQPGGQHVRSSGR